MLNNLTLRSVYKSLKINKIWMYWTDLQKNVSVSLSQTLK